MYNGFPQIYSTQRAGKSFHKIRDMDKVDKLRSDLGLESLASYAERHGVDL